MVEKRNCSFCGQAIEPGTGKMYIKKDGTVFNFCSNKCKKNNIGLGRVSRRTQWTTRYVELKASALGREKVAEAEPEEKPEEEKPRKVAPKKAAPAKPVKKPAPVKKESPTGAPAKPVAKAPRKEPAPVKKESPAEE